MDVFAYKDEIYGAHVYGILRYNKELVFLMKNYQLTYETFKRNIKYVMKKTAIDKATVEIISKSLESLGVKEIKEK